MSSFRVRVGTTSPFWIFDLARQLEARGHLEELFTGFPPWWVKGVPRGRVRSFPWLVSTKSLLAKWGAESLASQLSWPSLWTLDKWMAKNLSDCDIFHCLSASGLETHRVAREKYNALTICGRGSSHAVYQREILTEEYSRWGMQYDSGDDRILERELKEYEECDLVTVPSTFAKRSFIEMGVPEEKVRQIPYGVDLSTFKPVEKKDDVFRVLYVGSLGLPKGLPYLLKAVSELDLPNFECCLIGPKKAEIEPFLEKYEGSYRYLGPKPRAELYKYYSQGSVLVLPSIQEGLALVQAEAMACRLPVIATPNTGGEDLFTDGKEGFIVPIRDPDAIRARIQYLYDNPGERSRMAKEAFNTVQSLGGWDDYGAQIVKTYEEAISS